MSRGQEELLQIKSIKFFLLLLDFRIDLTNQNAKFDLNKPPSRPDII